MAGDGRYSRQILFRALGAEGQERISAGIALLVGCGALGSHVAELLVRAGLGRLRIVDRDFVEISNLHRQSLFDESDVRLGLPKAVAARRHLREVNSEVIIEAFPEQLDCDNIDRRAAGAQVIVDGTDNFDTRFLMNDFAIRNRVPWVYGACVGAYGLTATIVPDRSPCLRCLIGSVPSAGSVETCDTAGVIPPAPAFVASLQSVEALKILSGHVDAVSRDLVAADLWTNSIQRVRLDRDRLSRDCPACALGQYEYLEGERGMQSTVLCGRNAVQIRPPAGRAADLELIADRLRPHGALVKNRFLVRAEIEGCVMAVFADGRTIVSGTDDAVRARALYDRFVGS